MSSIPVVDLEGVFSVAELASCPQVDQIHSAFSTVGFVFVKNHGIARKTIDDAFSVAKKFFSLSSEEKLKCQRLESTGNNGYVCLEQESVDPSKPGDLKECYNICSAHTNWVNPSQEVPNFKSVITQLHESCSRVALKLLEIMGHGLQLEDPQFFVKAHQKMGQGHSSNYTTMRLLYYPPLPPNSEIKPGQLRCGEHVDYGSITLLFQDPHGGLQVKRSDGGYIDVPYMSDAILVNLGALMQQWTSDKYLATPHRVLLPAEEVKRRAVRRSIAFFAHPDNDIIVECIDGSNKHPPITAKEDTDRRLQASYLVT